MDYYHAAIYHNLRMLVKIFPNLEMESKLQEGMFRKPNASGMQAVFYSLMMVLNSEYCRQHVPWPIAFKSDNYKFRTSVINFIKTECPDFEPPQLLPSLLNKADGEKYVKLVFDFVSYVSKKIILRKNVSTLNMPSLTIDEVESYCTFERLTTFNHMQMCSERQSLVEQHKEMLKNVSMFINFSVNERKELSKRIRDKKEDLYEELKHLLSYTNVNEKDMIDHALLDYKTDVHELRRTYFLVQRRTCQLLTKKERLLQLIHLQQNFEGNLINSEYLKSAVTRDVASKINVPLSIILPSLFLDSENGYLINLKEFVHYGYLLLKARQRRILGSKIPDHQDVVYQKANLILCNMTEKKNEIKSLNEALEKNICECKQRIPNLQNLFKENTSLMINDDFIETMRVLISMKNHRPTTFVQFPDRSLLIEVPKTSGTNEKVIAKLKHLLKKDSMH